MTKDERPDGRYDVLVDVEKFNPFHDRLGRFTSGSGFMSSGYIGDPSRRAVTFSANPDTKAGAMAIARHSDRQGGHELIGAAYGTKEPEHNPAQDKLKSKAPEGLVKGLGKEHAEAMQAMIDKAPDEAQALWSKYAGEVKVATSTLPEGKTQCYKPATDSIYVNVAKNSAGNGINAPHETTFHESAHAMDAAMARKFGMGDKFSVGYKGGLFEQTIVGEVKSLANGIKKDLQAANPTKKIAIADAYSEIEKRLWAAAKGGNARDVANLADVLGGATKGKIAAVAGHSKSYWTGKKTYFGKTPGQSVAVEAFAEMFASVVANPGSLKTFQEWLPQSYGVFQDMIKDAV